MKIAFVFLSLVAAVRLDAQDIPACSTPAGKTALDKWLQARGRPTSVTASSDHRFMVPSATATDDCDGPVDLSNAQDGHFNDGIHSWLMAGRCKEAVCGTALSNEPNCGFWLLTGECDFNNNIVLPNLPNGDPREHAGQLLAGQACAEDLLQGGGDIFGKYVQEGRPECFEKPGPAWKIHAEVSPPHGPIRDALKPIWRDDPGYHLWQSSLSGGEMCVYGPLVGDTGHGLKAEIHPVQMYWWTRAAPLGTYDGAGPYDLVFIQDASARYGNEFGYVIRDELPQVRAWAPWSQAPLHGQFDIPVWVPEQAVEVGSCGEDRPAGAPPLPAPAFSVEPWLPCKGTKAFTPSQRPAPECVSTSAPRVYIANGAKSGAPEKFELKLDWACRCDAGTCDGKGGLLAYIRVSGTVGVDRDFGEGAIGLTLLDPRGAPAAPPDCAQTTSAAALRAAAPVARELTVMPAPGMGDRTVSGQIQRLMEKKSGTQVEETQAVGLVQQPLEPYLTMLKWPNSLPTPPAEGILRPKEITLEMTPELRGYTDKQEESAKVTVTWSQVLSCDALKVQTDEQCDPIVTNKTGRRLKVTLPSNTRPLELRVRANVSATVDGETKSGLVDQKLWADRIALKRGAETQAWIRALNERIKGTDGGRPLCARPQLAQAVARLTGGTERRGEIALTTLALLAEIANSGCQAQE
ncbi:MAG TPA: hypothetical protein VIK51_23450 [Vicinamibacteria bacterium]|jgi:hypothetical protein